MNIIPPFHSNRTLVLCFDGTGDQFDADNSNIVQLFSMLKKDDRTLQMVYYQAGIGTYTSPQIATPLMSNISKTLDEMIAWNIDAHVMDGYEFLMQNYTAGDRICIFGFSRGAYTARSLAGMIHKVGLLPANNFQQVPFAYKMYTRADEVGWEQSNAFKRAFSIDVDIEFIGVWDTVSSVGLIPRTLPFTTSNTIVRTFRHAVSLDERRAKFKANLWNRPNDVERTLGTGDPKLDGLPHAGARSSIAKSIDGLPGNRDQDAFERRFSRTELTPTDVEEVWFAGCHCDVGGGSVTNNTRHTLARIPLRWMIRECFKTNTGILFDAARLPEAGLDPHTLYPAVLPRPPPKDASDLRLTAIGADTDPARAKGSWLAPSSWFGASAASSATAFSAPPPMLASEEDEELRDALAPAYDQLRLAWGWWALELVPMRQRFQRADDSWGSWVGWNLGRARVVPAPPGERRVGGAVHGAAGGGGAGKGLKVHRSVRMRMGAKGERGEGYEPKAALCVEPMWVD